MSNNVTRSFTVLLVIMLPLLSPMGAIASNYCPSVWDPGGFWKCSDPPPLCPAGKVGTCTSVRGANGNGACDACPAVNSGGGCLSIGAWGCQPNAPLAQNTVITFTLAHESGNHVEIADFSDIDSNGMVLQSQVLDGAGDFVGTFDLTIESGPASAIPVRVTSINLTAGSVNFRGDPTGVNTIQLGPSGANVVGYYDSVNDRVKFDQGIPAIVVNDLFPGGIAVSLAPGIVGNGGSYELHPIGVLNLPPPISAASNFGIFVLLLLLVTGAILAVRGRRTTLAS